MADQPGSDGRPEHNVPPDLRRRAEADEQQARSAGRPPHGFTDEHDPGLPQRRREYFWIMGTCLTLFVLAWGVVRLWSIPVAVGMSVVAAVLPPVAAIVGNRSRSD